jgi:riboflavin kinase/FMN adenylyltransferase
MRVIESVSDIAKITKGCVLTIGNFDGVHLGHQQILAAARQTAAEKQTELVAMTFDPHPVVVLHPQESLGVLTPLELKSSLLAYIGVDTLVVITSTLDILSLSPDAFVRRFLVEAVRPGVVVEGPDFNFGAGRKGDIHTLQELGNENGFSVSIIQARQVQLSTGQSPRVSSTLIRGLLQDGSVADAALALGRPYRLIGQVVPGHGRGKQLGFPTANLQPAKQIIPAEGVYAGFVEIGQTAQHVCEAHEKTLAALSIGSAKTFAGDKPQLIEAHLLSENVAPLADKWLAMDFIRLLRRQIKFDPDRQLAEQIAKDCEDARGILTFDSKD